MPDAFHESITSRCPWPFNQESQGQYRLLAPFERSPRFCSDHPDGTIEVGNWFGVDYQGKGYASEALRATLDQIATDPDLSHRSIFAEC